MEITAIIKNMFTRWKEDFEVTSMDTAEAEVKAIIVNYNNTLQGSDVARKFVKLHRSMKKQ